MRQQRFKAGDRVSVVGDGVEGTVVGLSPGRVTAQPSRGQVLVLFDGTDLPMGVPLNALERLQLNARITRH